MRKLTANRPILYLGRQFSAGDALPASDPNMVAAWLRAGSAVWTGENPADPSADEKAITGHLDAAHLVNTMKLDELKKLAADMGVDIGSATTKKAIADLLASVEVIAHAAGDGEGGTQ